MNDINDNAQTSVAAASEFQTASVNATPSTGSVLARAKRYGIGPFAQKQKSSSLGANFNHDDQTNPLACAVGSVSNFVHGGLDGLDANKDAYTKYFAFTLANVRFRVEESPKGIIRFTLNNDQLKTWQQGTTPMNQRAAKFALDVIKDQMSDAVIEKKYDHMLLQTRSKSLDEIKSAYAALIERLEKEIPADEPLQLKPRDYLGKEDSSDVSSNLSEIFHNRHRKIQFLPAEQPFLDKPLEILHMPLCRPYVRRPLEATYGAFSFCKDGVSHWVQFKNLDASDANEFTIITPSEAGERDRKQKTMSRREALSALETIQESMSEEQRQKFASTLDRLKEAALKLPTINWEHLLEERIKFIDYLDKNQNFEMDFPLNKKLPIISYGPGK